MFLWMHTDFVILEMEPVTKMLSTTARNAHSLLPRHVNKLLPRELIKVTASIPVEGWNFFIVCIVPTNIEFRLY